jgi:radical SAM superfamily enzyme YgiQ (UPF0313 family)
MRIQLIHPPFCVNPRAIQATRPSLPLGVAYVAAALRDAGHTVLMLDAVQAAPERSTRRSGYSYIGLSPDEIAEALDPQADAYALSVMFSFSWPLVRDIAHAVKARHPDTLLVGGGEHFAGLPERSLREAPLDYLVIGEGERTAVSLFQALQNQADPGELPGLAHLRAGEFVQTGRPPRIREVDALRRPAWDLFDVQAYYRQGHVFGVDHGMTMPILATRGCPYACTYCSNANMWGRNWFARSPENVVDEIADYHRQYGATNFPFHDLTAIVRKSWIKAFAEEVIRRDLRIHWQLPSGTRCEAIDDEVAQLMVRSGGTSLTFAPESGSARTRELIGKRMTEESLVQAVRASVAAGLNVSAFFVVGFPHDTQGDLWQSVRLAVKLAWLGVNDLALSVFFPIPGTPLYDELLTDGRVHESDSLLLAPLKSMNARIGQEENFCRNLSARRVTAMKYAILMSFYLTSMLTRPWRPFALIANTIAGRETCKMDIFLIAQRRRFSRYFAAGVRRFGFLREPEIREGA